MEVEVIYRQPDGTQTKLGVRKMADIPPIGKRVELDDRQYIAESYGGPDAEGRYRLFLEDEEDEDEGDVTRH